MLPIIERPSPANKAPAACLPAPAVAGQGVGTYQSMRSSSSRASGACSLTSTHLCPGGAVGVCGAGAPGSLKRASEIPSLTPALIAEYSTQYVISSPITAAINCSNSPSPISPMSLPSLKDTNGTGFLGVAFGCDKGAACSRRRSAAQAAPSAALTLPVGNHGEINGKGRSV